MKTMFLFSILILFCQSARAQETSTLKEFWIENPVAKDKTKIEKGNKVFIRLRTPTETIQGTILAVSDSSVTLGIRRGRHRQIVPFRKIADMKVVKAGKKKYNIRVTLKSGKKVSGVLIRITQDSLSLLRRNSQHRVGTSEIKSIRINRKGAIAIRRTICAGLGGILGAVIGGIILNSAYKPQLCSTPLCVILEVYEEYLAIYVGAAIGGAAGSLTGMAIGSIPGKEFKIEGDQAKFDLFANEFKNKVSFEKSK